MDGDSDAPLLGKDDDLEKIHSEWKQFPTWKRYPKCRHILAFLAFLGFVNVYALRVNLSVAIVSMVNSTTKTSENDTKDDECNKSQSTSSNDTTSGPFSWTDDQQALVLGAFFYGYITTQILGGWLAEKFGGKHLLGFGILCTAVFTLLTPVASYTSFRFLIAVRVLEGIGEGVTFPAMHALLAQWAPPLERSKLGTFVYAGAQFGTVVSMPISGLLCKHVGWESVFYVFGSLGCAWWFFWVVFVYNKPSEHPRITAYERDYIERTIGQEKQIKMPTPWLKIFTSIRFWAILVAHFCNNWGFYTLLTCLPQYMNHILDFDISQNGILSSLPYLVMWIMINVAGQIADFLRFNHYLSTTSVRKLATAIGLGSPAVFLVITGYLGCDPMLAVLMITLAVGLSGFNMAGQGINHLDIAPPFAGTLMGLTNTTATIPGFLGPIVVMQLTKTHNNRQQWQKIFFISAAIYAFGVVFYSLFGSGKEQPWSRPGVRDMDDDTEPIYQSEEEEEGSDEEISRAVDDVLKFR